MRLTRYFVIIAVVIAANFAFAGSVVTQKVVTAKGFVKGSTTVSLSGQMTESAMDGIARGESIAVYNSLDSYLVFPTLLQKTKTGYGKKFNTKNVSVSAKNGKFQWTEKDVTKYLSFAVGRERIKPDKATLKSSGTVDTADLVKLDDKRLTVYDYSCAEKGLGHLASLSCPLEKKGKNYKYSKKDQDLQVKLSANSNGKVSASYKLQPNIASPAFIDNEYVFTNKYDYSLVIVGEGEVYSGFYGPDQVEFDVTENSDKFRFFYCKGVNVTNNLMTLELNEDTEVTAVFGNYDFRLNVIGGGSAKFEFTGPDEVAIGALKDSAPFRHFLVNGRIYTSSNIHLMLTKDTVVEAVFGTYDFTTRVIGGGYINYEFTEPDLVEIKALDGNKFFRYFLVNGQKRTEKALQLPLQEDTVVEAVFGTYDFSLEIVGNGSVDVEFTGPDNVEVRVLDGDAPFRNFTVNDTYCADETMSLALQEDTVVKAVFGTYAFRTEVLGNGSEEHEFLGPDLVEVRVPQNSAFWRYFTVNGETRKNTTTLLLYLKEDTVVEAVFGIYALYLGVVGPGQVSREFTGQDEVEIKVTEGSDLFRFFNVNRIICSDSSIQLSLEHDTVVNAVFGRYRISVEIVGDGSLDYEFKGQDDVEIKIPEDAEHFRYLTVNGNKSFEKNLLVKMTGDTAVKAFFGKYDCETVVVGSGILKSEFTGADEITLRAINEEDIFSHFEWNGCVTNLSPVSIQLVSDTVITAVFSAANYMVVDLSSGTSAKTWSSRITKNKPDITSDKCRGEELWLRYVPPGVYMMGSPKNEAGRGNREDQHEVTITKGFYIGIFEVTQKQFKYITDTSYYSDKEATYPVRSVNYNQLKSDASITSKSVIKVMRDKTRLQFDLPTEAQWEYACRAGTTTAYNSGNNMGDKGFDLTEICIDIYVGSPQKVGIKKPNKWGLYDMHGNVWEWCLDWYTDNLGFDPVVDPTGPETGEKKVLRGGCYRSWENECRSAYRSYLEPDHYVSPNEDHRFGFRFVINEK